MTKNKTPAEDQAEEPTDDYSDVLVSINLTKDLNYLMAYVREKGTGIEYAGIVDHRVEKVLKDMNEGFLNISNTDESTYHKKEITHGKLFVAADRFSSMQKELDLSRAVIIELNNENISMQEKITETLSILKGNNTNAHVLAAIARLEK